MAAEVVVGIGPASGEMRRRLGPASWVVFEELLIAATTDCDGWHATVSVRVLAERTGLSKDTVARAVGRLRRAGLVTPHQSRDAGTFAAGSYELTIPNGITIGTTSTATHTSRNRTTAGAQLSLPIES